MPVRSSGQCGHSDDRPGLRGPVELLVTIAPIPAQLRYSYPGQDLTCLQSRCQVVDEEVARRDLTVAARAASDHGGAQRDSDGRQVACRIAMGQGPAEGAAVPYRWI